MRLKIYHETRYRFENPVSYGLQQLRKTPKTNTQQRVLTWQTQVTGGRKELVFDDYHNNVIELISFDRGTTDLLVTSAGEVEMTDSHGIVGRHRGPAPLWLYQRETERTRARAGVRALVKQAGGDGDLDRLHSLLPLITQAVDYETGVSWPYWTAEDALEEGRGVCQDHAHIFIACARDMGFAARYVSGYLLMDDRIEQEAMHAWAEAHVEGLGWVGFDVSNGISPDTRYVRVATGLDYSDAAPVSGTRVGGDAESLDVRIEVQAQQ
ncbi:transglutaminase family protein [Lacimonas salitolerans]|uniref:Transglutaminase domain-containing protein n=1 Tax=Lacimonas salitolerans TaxID=1323750 RepID=A0ABW4EGS8_9RHOB